MPIELPHTPTDQTPEPPRDRWGRYVIPDPVTGQSRSWVRATTIAKTLDDSHNLTEWAKRSVARGVAQKPHLVAGILAAGDDRKRLDTLVEEAMQTAGANDRRELGTALHKILERVDTGDLDIAAIPAEHGGSDAHAYRNALTNAGLTVETELCEVVLVNQPLGVAGTCDRFLRLADGTLAAADLKTGAYLSWLAFAVQLSLYATATHIYNPVDGTLHAMPPVRDDIGLIIHLEAGSGRCDIHAINLKAGYDAALMALEVRQIRKTDNRKTIAVDNWQPAPAPAPKPAAKKRTVKHTFTAAAATIPDRATVTDEGPRMTDEQIARIRSEVVALHPDARQTLEELARSAKDAGHPFSVGAGPHLRRWHIYRALIRLARRWPTDLTDAHIRATIAEVVPAVRNPTIHLGAAIGQLDLEKAQQFVIAANKAINDTVHLTCHDNGPRWTLTTQAPQKDN